MACDHAVGLGRGTGYDVTDPVSLRGKKLIHVVTVPQSLGFFRGQLRFMQDLGLHIEVICGPGEGIDEFAAREGVRVHVVPMARRIDPRADVRAIRAMRKIYRDVGPDIVHAHTPKGGLLGVLSARSAGIPLVIYQLRGLRLATLTGSRRLLFEAVERTSLNLAHGVIANSHSLRQEVIDLGLVDPARIRVLGAGSGNGVDARGRFDPARVPAGRREELRGKLGVKDGEVLIVFIGRLVRDKGIGELAEAWRQISTSHPTAHLALIGGEDDTDPVPPEVLSTFVPERRAHRVPATQDVQSWYAASDVVVLPTYREGMPNVLLEAAAMGKPVVATKVAGCVDCVADGRTGWLVEPRDAHALLEGLLRYVSSATLRAQHGGHAREHAIQTFDPSRLFGLLAGYYGAGLAARSRGPRGLHER